MAKDYAKRQKPNSKQSARQKLKHGNKKQAVRHHKRDTKKKQPEKRFGTLLAFLIMIAILVGLFLFFMHLHHQTILDEEHGETIHSAMPVYARNLEQGTLKPVQFKFVSAEGLQYQQEAIFLQLGLYSPGDRLAHLREVFNQQRINAHFIERIKDDKPVFRVQIGPFKTKSEAKKLQDQLDTQKIYSALSN
jgi:hypothetical protein